MRSSRTRSLPSILLFLLAAAVGCGGSDEMRAEAAPDFAQRPPADIDGGGNAAPGTVDGNDAGTNADGKALLAMDPPSGRRLGATVDAGGVTFRVWAPGAKSAFVAIDTQQQRIAMHVENDIWVARVDGARAGQSYRYVFERADGATLERIDPYCREIGEAGNTSCVVIDPSTYAWQSAFPFVRPEQRASVIYEMHVGSFAVPDGKPHGTFASTRGAPLARLADLGINVVELMPAHSFGGNPNGWGYNPQLFFAPKKSYGSSADLRALIDDAHSRGIAMWLDVVYNHTDGWKQAPLRCFDGTKCDSAEAANGIYFFQKGVPYEGTPWGPRPAYSTPQVRDMILDSVHAWLAEYRGDGFRWDSTSNIRGMDGQGTVPGGRDLMVRANEWSKKLGATSTAEDLKGFDALTRASNDNGGFAFDAQWDGFGYAVMDVVANTVDDNARDLGRLEGALRGTSAGDPFARILWIENHDTVGNNGARFSRRVDGADPTSLNARRRSMLGGVLLLTAPGMPMIFQGQEDLVTDGFTDPPARLPITASAAGQRMHAFYKDMIRLRRNLDGKSGGLLEREVEIIQRNDTAKVLAYRRHGASAASSEDVIVVMNLRNRAFPRYDIGVPRAGTWRVRLDTNAKTYGEDFDGSGAATFVTSTVPRDGHPFTLSVALSPYSAIILTQ